MNEYTYCNSISYINIIEEAIKISVRKKKLNLYGYPSEISIADFGYIPYSGNDKASRKSLNAWFVSYHKNKKDVNNFVTSSISHR